MRTADATPPPPAAPQEDAAREAEGAAMTAADVCEHMDARSTEFEMGGADRTAAVADEPEAKRRRPAAPAQAPASTVSNAIEIHQSAHMLASEAQPLKRRRMRKKGPGPQPGHDVSPEQRLLSPCLPAPVAFTGASTASSCTGGVPSRKGLTVADVAGSWCPISAPRGGGGTSGSPPAQLRTVESTGTDSKARISGEDRDSRPCSRA